MTCFALAARSGAAESGVGGEQPLVQQRGRAPRCRCPWRSGRRTGGGSGALVVRSQIHVSARRSPHRRTAHPGSILRHRLVEVQDRAGDHRPGGQLGDVEALVARRLAHLEQLQCRLRGRRDRRTGCASNRSRSTASSAGFGRRAVARRKARAIRASSGAGCLLGHQPLGELARGLDVGRVVEQHQGLERRIGPGAADGAGLAIGGVEGRRATAGARSASRTCTSSGGRGRGRGSGRRPAP